AEASSAAAGILGAQAEAHEDGTFARLCLAGRRVFAEWESLLRKSTGIDIEYRRCGVLQVAFDARAATEIVRASKWQAAIDLPVEELDADRARFFEPELSRKAIGGVRFANDARVDPPSYFKALRIAAESAGATFRAGTIVRKIAHER